jgi:16S rRNA (uracil1498-N3)-methyltransferase
MVGKGGGPPARAPRLYVEEALSAGAHVALTRDRAHYLGHVLRLGPGAEALVFNGRDGEWRARIAEGPRRGLGLDIGELTRSQPPAPDLDYLFAPLKHARLDYMVQKATEMGAGRLRPVLTRRTQVARVNGARMRANVIEAAEQCGVVAVPQLMEPRSLESVIAEWPPERALVFADEAGRLASPLPALAGLRGRPLAVLVGPEGGFTAEERAAVLAVPAVVAISLGPRVMRADTAAVAALAVVQAAAGDWGR